MIKRCKYNKYSMCMLKTCTVYCITHPYTAKFGEKEKTEKVGKEDKNENLTNE